MLEWTENWEILLPHPSAQALNDLIGVVLKVKVVQEVNESVVLAPRVLRPAEAECRLQAEKTRRYYNLSAPCSLSGLARHQASVQLYVSHDRAGRQELLIVPVFDGDRSIVCRRLSDSRAPP
ncbi:MAG: hypothetical protein V1821_02080 [bacterium]